MKLLSNIPLFLISFIAIISCSSDLAQTDQKPNIVLILADDLGYGDIKTYNAAAKVNTPNLDQMCNEGMRFMDAHSPSAVCTPTRYGILTGRYSWRSRLKKGVLWPWDSPLIEKDRKTLPDMLKDEGYQTAAIGKWHLGWNWPTTDSIPAINTKGKDVDYSRPILGGPRAIGFDYYYGDDVPNFPPYVFIENEKVTALPDEEKPKGMFGIAGAMAPGWTLDAVMPAITQKSVDYIENKVNEEKPFFLYFALTAPHTPIAPAAEFKGSSDAGAYGDYVQQVDWTVGQVMEALKRKGLEENTIVIFTSDNGSPARNGANHSGPVSSVIQDYGHKANGNLRGFKGDAWEGGHRVPFIVKWPNQIEAGSKTDGLISSLDIMATVRDILGIPKEAEVSPDGQSMMSSLKDASADARDYLVHHSHQGVFAIRKGDWKLILSQKSGGFSDGLNRDGFGIETDGQLYNLKEDPAEQNNLYAKQPAKVKELSKMLERIKDAEVN
ncbi:arylsulfatase [Echinicola marina]|uniref:sulfatase family protein n=1 Tax=Echinicola marina TaxID=2859768 RepID=UPI001CF6A849|nr:arylsulfatase [Echinicola marina]UCS94664.1 arylsulfatase [Echinicola marina]